MEGTIAWYCGVLKGTIAGGLQHLFNHVQVGCSFINIRHNLPTSTIPKELSKANFKNEICQVDIEIVEET
jgi:hypothetical protein